MRTRLGSLSVRRFGPDDGDPTVFWSSMFVDSHTWDGMLPLLLRSCPERSFVLIDPPGLGVSEPLRRRSSIAEAADAARDALDVLACGRPVDWVGNAFGGHVGYELAVRPGVLRSLVAISAPVEAIAPALRLKIEVLAPLLRVAGPVGPVRAAVIDAMVTERAASDPGIRDLVVASLERPGRRSMSFALRSFILDRVDVSQLMPKIAVPSLFVASDDRGDWSPADAERAAAAVGPLARTVTIRDARTLVPLEQPRSLTAELMAFWSEGSS